MKYYKYPNTNQVYAYEADGSQDNFIKPGLVQITEQEAIDLTTPPIPEPEPLAPITKFSSLAYLDRFTQSEQVAIATATYTDVEVKLFYDKLLGADFIDLEDPRVALGLDFLISKSLLAPERKAELLTPGDPTNEPTV